MAQRAKLLAALSDAGRESSTATVLLHTAIADRIGLSASDTKTLDVLLRQGPCTAGELARHTGLTTPSVTSLIDRLERKRLVAREADPRDRRRVIVHPVLARIAKFAPLYGAIGKSFEEFFSQYSDAQLATILDFMKKSAERSRQIATSISTSKSRSQSLRRGSRSAERASAK
jgi:DNA-binding MarR family transcriptional regulator